MAEWMSIFALHVEQQEKGRQKKIPPYATVSFKLTVSRSLEILSKLPQLEMTLQANVDEIIPVTFTLQ